VYAEKEGDQATLSWGIRSLLLGADRFLV
jgi:hypothetical protein